MNTNTLVRRINVKDGHRLKRPSKTVLWKKLRENQIGNTPRLKPFKKTKTQQNVDVSFDDYNDYCTECEDHDKCHKNGIDYDKVARCKEDVETQIRREAKIKIQSRREI